MSDDALPEIPLWPLNYWRPIRIKALRLAGSLRPVADLFRADAPRPNMVPSKRPQFYDFDYYGGVRSVRVYTPTCPHCGQQLLHALAAMPAGTCARISQDSRIWGRWHGHLSAHPDCAHAAFAVQS